MMSRGMKMLFFVPLAILGGALFIFLGGELVLHLWNWLTPTLFGWRQITFWQALGLLVLCRILFGGLGSHNSGRHKWGRRTNGRCDEKTPEEREQLRQRMRERFGFDAPSSENKS